MKNKLQQILSNLAICAVLCLWGCGQKEQEAVPFEWADGKVVAVSDVSPQSSFFSIVAPKITHRDLSRFGIPTRISASNVSSESLLSLIKNISTIKNKSVGEIQQMIADGKITLTLSYLLMPTAGNGVYKSKSVVLKPNLSNLNALDITIQDLAMQDMFKTITKPLAQGSNQEAYFVALGTSQRVALTAADNTNTRTEVATYIGATDINGFGDWQRD